MENNKQDEIRVNFCQYPQRTWTEAERKEYDKIERSENYGMTFLEWSDFVETHTGDDIQEHINNYYKSIGKERKRFKPIGPGILYDSYQHQNDQGKIREKHGSNIFKQ